MNRVVELYEANHLMVLVIVFIGFIIYISAMKNKFHKSLFVQNEVDDEDENEDEIGASAPRIYMGSRVIIKYILTDDIVEIEICDTQNRIENNVVFVNHHMPLATSLLNKEVGDIIKFKKNTKDKNFIYVEVLQIGDYVTEEEIPESQVEDEMNLNTENKSVNMEFKEYSYSRLRVTQEMYDYLITNPNMGLKINVSKNNGNHPIGYYEIPYHVAIRFIEEKQTFPNWKDYKNFNQETIPSELRDYFTPVPSNNINLNDLNKKTLKINSPKEIKMTKDLKSDTLENFKNYLIQNDYKEFTPAGNPSTVYDYVNRVKNILDREKISIQNLATNIDSYVKKYDVDGIEAEYGNVGHRAVINALKRFQDFCR
jgi:hypothetical protein